MDIFEKAEELAGIFIEFSCDIEIETEKQYEKTNGTSLKELDIKETKQLKLIENAEIKDVKQLTIGSIIDYGEKETEQKEKETKQKTEQKEQKSSEKELKSSEKAEQKKEKELKSSEKAGDKAKRKIVETAKIATSNPFIAVAQEKSEKEKERLRNANYEMPYIKVPLLTDAETQFYHYMRNHLCQIEKIVIFPKVRLADIVNVDENLTRDNKYLWKITNKHVDFLICNAFTLETICVVELDDYTHETEEGKARDLFIMQVLYEAGIKIARVKSRIRDIQSKDLDLANEYINQALAPKCPYCGITMIPRKQTTGNHVGHRFYGCANYMSGCRHTIDIDKIGETLP